MEIFSGFDPKVLYDFVLEDEKMTLPETKMVPENGCFENYFSFFWDDFLAGAKC